MRKWLGRGLLAAALAPLPLFFFLPFNFDSNLFRCAERGHHIIDYRGVNYCVTDFWAFVDFLTIPWGIIIATFVLAGLIRPDFVKWLNGKTK